MSTRERFSRTGWDQLPSQERLRGTDVCDQTGDKIGTVDEIYVEGDSNVRYLAVKTGWFGSKRHIVPMDEVTYSEESNAVILPYGRERLESAPTYDDRDRLSDRDERSIYGFYGRTGYWEEVQAKQTTPSATPEIAQADVAAARAHGTDTIRDDIPSNMGAGDADLDGDDRYTRGVRRYDNW